MPQNLSPSSSYASQIATRESLSLFEKLGTYPALITTCLYPLLPHAIAKINEGGNSCECIRSPLHRRIQGESKLWTLFESYGFTDVDEEIECETGAVCFPLHFIYIMGGRGQRS